MYILVNSKNEQIFIARYNGELFGEFNSLDGAQYVAKVLGYYVKLKADWKP